MLQPTIRAIVRDWLAVREVNALVVNGGASRIDVFFGDGASVDTVPCVHAEGASFGAIALEECCFVI